MTKSEWEKSFLADTTLNQSHRKKIRDRMKRGINRKAEKAEEHRIRAERYEQDFQGVLFDRSIAKGLDGSQVTLEDLLRIVEHIDSREVIMEKGKKYVVSYLDIVHESYSVPLAPENKIPLADYLETLPKKTDELDIPVVHTPQNQYSKTQKSYRAVKQAQRREERERRRKEEKRRKEEEKQIDPKWQLMFTVDRWLNKKKLTPLDEI